MKGQSFQWSLERTLQSPVGQPSSALSRPLPGVIYARRLDECVGRAYPGPRLHAAARGWGVV